MKTRGRPSAPPRRHADGGEGGEGQRPTAGLLQLTGTRSSRTSPYGSRRGRSAGTEPGRNTTETLTATWN